MIEAAGTVVAPAPAGPGRGHRRAGPRAAAGGLLAFGRLGQPAFWLLLALFILAPATCFLVLAVSPGSSAKGHSGSR